MATAANVNAPHKGADKCGRIGYTRTEDVEAGPSDSCA